MPSEKVGVLADKRRDLRMPLWPLSPRTDSPAIFGSLCDSVKFGHHLLICSCSISPAAMLEIIAKSFSNYLTLGERVCSH
jgi:hypothetical protein